MHAIDPVDRPEAIKDLLALKGLQESRMQFSFSGPGKLLAFFSKQTRCSDVRSLAILVAIPRKKLVKSPTTLKLFLFSLLQTIPVPRTR